MPAAARSGRFRASPLSLLATRQHGVVHRQLRALGLSDKRISARVRSSDLYWPSFGVIVEADGDHWHKTPADRARDARRDRKLTGSGHRVLRVTDTEYGADPDGVVADLLAALTPLAA